MERQKQRSPTHASHRVNGARRNRRVFDALLRSDEYGERELRPR
jgi:hypothetical protein